LGSDLHNSVRKLGPGLDLRATGGYVVAPPSLHASGLRYEWCSPQGELADAPAWLSKAKPAVAIVADPVGPIPEGQRNSALLALGGAMRRRGASPAAIESALLMENQERCQPPMSEEEVRRIAANASQYRPGPQNPKFDPTRRPDLVRLSDVVAKQVPWLWEPYLPLEMITVLSGDPGAGKTFICVAIAAAITRGECVVGEGTSLRAKYPLPHIGEFNRPCLTSTL